VDIDRKALVICVLHVFEDGAGGWRATILVPLGTSFGASSTSRESDLDLSTIDEVLGSGDERTLGPARKAASAATSSGRPRAAAVVAPPAPCGSRQRSGRACGQASIAGVAMGPGVMTLTRTPRGPTRPPRPAQTAHGCLGRGVHAHPVGALMDGGDASRITDAGEASRGSDFCTVSRLPLVFTPKTKSNCSSVTSCRRDPFAQTGIGHDDVQPPPVAADHVHDLVQIGGLRDVARHRTAPGPMSSATASSFVLAPAGQIDAGAVICKALGDRPSDTAGAR